MSDHPKLTLRDFWEARAKQSFWITRATASPTGAVLAWVCYRLRFSPNQVTLLALACGLAGTIIVVTFDLSPWVDGLVLFGSLYLSYALDCADGMLARAARAGSDFGVLADKLADAVSILLIPGMLGVACLREELSDRLTWHLAFLLWAIAPRMLFSVLSWLKDSLAYGMDHLRDDSRPRTWLWYVRRFLGNFIDDMTWRTGLAVSWATGFFWEFSTAYGALCSVFFAGYLIQAYYELQPCPAGRIRLTAGRQIGTHLLGWLSGLIRLLNRLCPGVREGVVVIEPFGMGDAISLEPLVRRLSRRSVVYLCIRPQWHELYSRVDNVHVIECEVPWINYDSSRKYDLRAYLTLRFWRQLITLRRIGWGRAGIDPRGDIRSVLLLRLAGCREVHSLDCYLGTMIRLPRMAGRLVKWEPGLRRWQSNLRFLPSDEVSDPEGGPRFTVDAGAGVDREEDLVGLVPLAPWRGKLWRTEGWRSLVWRLGECGIRIVGLSGPGDAVAARTILDGPDVIECRGTDEWARALGRCRAVVTVDSGPMHLAEAVGTPVIALMGSTLMPLWSPWREQSRIITHQSEVPGLPAAQVDVNLDLSRRAMKLITATEVEQAVMEVLDGRPKHRKASASTPTRAGEPAPASEQS